MEHATDCCIFKPDVRLCTCIHGELTLAEVDDLVSAWLASSIGVSLCSYLAMTEAGYAAWKTRNVTVHR